MGYFFNFGCSPFLLSFGIAYSVMLIYLALRLTTFKKEDIYPIGCREELVFKALTLATLLTIVFLGEILPLVPFVLSLVLFFYTMFS